MSTSVPHKANPYYVYTLTNSLTNNVFYVGKGIGNRMHQHEEDARRGEKSEKSDLIRSIWDTSGKVILNKEAEFEDERDAYNAERELIEFYGGALVNAKRRKPYIRKRQNLSPFGELFCLICDRYETNGLTIAKLCSFSQTTLSLMMQKDTKPTRENVIELCRALKSHPKWINAYEDALLNLAGYSTQKQSNEAHAYLEKLKMQSCQTQLWEH